MVGGRFQVPRFQTEVRHVKVFGWNVTVDVAVEHKKLHKGLFHPDTQRRGGKGPVIGEEQLLAPLVPGIFDGALRADATNMLPQICCRQQIL